MSADNDETPVGPVDVPSGGGWAGYGWPGGVSRVVAMPWDDDGAWALVMTPYSDGATLAEAASRLPAGMRFVEAYGDVDVVMIYRPETALVPKPETQLLLAAALGVPAADVEAKPWPEWLPTPAVPADPDEIARLVAETANRMRRNDDPAGPFRAGST